MDWLTTVLKNITHPFKWWIVVAEWEQGLRVRFGKNTKVLTPGLHFRIPFIDRVYVQSIRLRTISFTSLPVLVKDGKTASINGAISFSVGNIFNLMNNLGTPEITLESIVCQGLVEHLLNIDPANICLEEIETKITQKGLCSSWGLSNFSFKVTGFTVCRAYRLISTDYRTGASLWNMDDASSGSGERR